DVNRSPVHVSVIVFPECDPSMMYGVYDTLWAAGRLWNTVTGAQPAAPLFEPRIVAADAGPLPLYTGVSIVPQDTIADVKQTDIVFVPNVMIDSGRHLRALDRRILDWIRRMHQQGAQLYAACGGPLVLAEAGVLDGLEATTHWTYAPLFRKKYPQVTLHEDRILVQSGAGHSVVCSGGASSWQDLVLMLIAKHGGAQEAIRISKLFLFQWHREGQLPYAAMIANVQHGDAAIVRCQEWLADNYARADIVAELVTYSGLAKRTFDRRFRAATGYSPLAYIQALRIEEAKQMLETGTAPVEAIAREVGYEDTASFRRLFQRLSGMTPGDYRRKFQLPRMVARAAAPTQPPRTSVGRQQKPNARAPHRREQARAPAAGDRD
ncbi:MAG TPA: helix-turn-helix domain-containing protein, partial [Alphaproteobacteria bacterium]|nr:helix-turn-helix domain-containing protein [Alphaproteobacteria bacterium]